MKIWTEVNIITVNGGKQPDVGNIKKFSWVPISKSKALVRISGLPSELSGFTPLSDEEALIAIKNYNPNANLENVDIADSEVNVIAKSLGIDPQIRADIKAPSRGKQLLQDQENYIMSIISTKKGKSKHFWDNEASKSGKYSKGIDIQNAILDGKCDAHEFILSRLRS